MKVLDIIKIVCDFVGESEIFSKLSLKSSLSGKEQEKVDRMIRCFNLVRQEIACDYLPLFARENVDANAILNFSSLSKKVIHIYEVKNRFGMNLHFKNFDNYIEISGRAKSVIYSYLPDDLTIDDEVIMHSGLSGRIYAYGVASEYLLIDGVSEDAEIWENRFKESLFVLSRKRGELVLPKRRWL